MISIGPSTKQTNTLSGIKPTFVSAEFSTSGSSIILKVPKSLKLKEWVVKLLVLDLTAKYPGVEIVVKYVEDK